MRIAILLCLAACSGRIEVYSVSPDQKHVMIGTATSIRSVEVDSLAEVAHASDVFPTAGFFSRDGSRFVARSKRGTLVVLPVAGGKAADLGPLIDIGAISPDGSRVAFLRNPLSCGSGFPCAELFSAPSGGGEATRVGSGIRVALSTDPDLIAPAALMDPYAFAGNDRLVFTTAQGALMSAPADGSAPGSVVAQARIPPIFWVLRDGRLVYQDNAGLHLAGSPLHLADDARSYLHCELQPDSTRDLACALSATGAVAVVTPGTDPPFTVRVVDLSGGPGFTVGASSDVLRFDRDGRLLFYDAQGFSAASPSGAVLHYGSAAVDGYLGGTSPDGRWFLFVSFLRTRDCGNCEKLQLFSTLTAATWNVTSAGSPLSIAYSAFSPDSASLLLVTADRKLAVVPASGGEPRVLEGEVDGADWAGPQHIVRTRFRSSPAGVRILKVP